MDPLTDFAQQGDTGLGVVDSAVRETGIGYDTEHVLLVFVVSFSGFFVGTAGAISGRPRMRRVRWCSFVVGKRRLPENELVEVGQYGDKKQMESVTSIIICTPTSLMPHARFILSSISLMMDAGKMIFQPAEHRFSKMLRSSCSIRSLIPCEKESVQPTVDEGTA